MILQGGAFAAGVYPPLKAVGNSWFTQSPGGDTVARYSPWFRLEQDPLGRGFMVVRSWVSQADYAANPIRASKSSELKQDEDIAEWGQTYTYYWRHIIDPNWITYPDEENTIIWQVHEVNGPAGVHRPTLECHLSGGQLIVMHTIDAYTLGIVVYQRAFTPGEEIHTYLRAKWADGDHVADADGILELYVNGALVWQINGQRNTWEPNPDIHPCYMVGGVYVPEQFDWWAGRDRLCYLVGMCIGDSAETPESLRLHVEGGLATQGATSA